MAVTPKQHRSAVLVQTLCYSVKNGRKLNKTVIVSSRPLDRSDTSSTSGEFRFHVIGRLRSKCIT
jgi:hypothetical protein